MINRFKNSVFLSAFVFILISPVTSFAWHDYSGNGDWDYYGSGRDHPYSAYIDRHYYVGPNDYATVQPEYMDAHVVFTNMPSHPMPPVVLAPPTTAEFSVNIPNSRGGFNTVIIKKDGDGFVGPNGEYYPEFPKIFQLQMKYGN